MAVYKPYIKKENGSISELPLYATTAGEVVNLGYYDTITENSDGTYTITRQTGYILLDGVIEKNASIAPNDDGTTYRYTFDIVNGSGQNGDVISNLLTKILFSDLVGGRTGIALYSASRCSICISGLTKLEDYKSHLAKNNIYVQYKLATATTEKVEKNHYARYNERFILEHNKNEAERSANLLPPSCFYPNNNIQLDGSLGTYPDYSCYYKVPVKPNTTYIASRNGGIISNDLGVAMYDSNGTFLKHVVWSGSKGTTENNVYYISFDFPNSYTNLMLNEGSVALPYQPYEGKVIHEKDLENLPKLYYHFLEILDGLSYYEVYIISTSSTIITNYYGLRVIAGTAINVPKDTTSANGDKIIMYRLNASGRYHNGNEAYYVLYLDVMMSQNTAYDKIIVTYNNAGNFIRSNKNLLSSATFKDKVTPIYGGQ